MNDATFNPFAELEAIAPTVTVGRQEYIAGRICFAMMFFIPVDFRFSVPERMVRAEARVRQDISLNTYAYWTAHEPYKPTVIAKQPPPNPINLLETFTAQNETHFGGAFNYRLWTGRLDGKAPPTQMLTYFYERDLERKNLAEVDHAATFQLNIPLTQLERLQRPQFLQKLFAELCAILQPLSALGGLCMATPLDHSVLQGQEHALRSLLENHPGLLVGRAFDMAHGMRFRMSSVNWLTAVRGDLLTRCGGYEGVLKQLSRPGFETASYGDDGILVQAGSSPQLGNLAENITLPHYGDLARALKPARLQIKEGHGIHMLHYGPEGMLYSKEVLAKSQTAWLARFDQMA